MADKQVNLLEYLQSKTQVDFDSFDIEAARDGPTYVDCTSNQFEYYTELAKTSRAGILQQSITWARTLRVQFSSVSFAELAVEVGIALLAIEMSPTVDGNIHVMSNPTYAFSKQKIIDNIQRIYLLFRIINPGFNRSRLVFKVTATWEGLQACRDLKDSEIKTLATAVFTMEQAVLAGEVGCVSISPFVHELKVIFEPRYKDTDPLLGFCVKAQQWYEQEGSPTKVKACATVGVDELLQLAGVDAITIVPEDLEALRSSSRPLNEVTALSLFKDAATDKLTYPSYIDDEMRYRIDFYSAEDGKAQLKLSQAITIFSDFQNKAENLIDAQST